MSRRPVVSWACSRAQRMLKQQFCRFVNLLVFKWLVLQQLLPDMDACSAGACGRDSCAVDSDAACGAREGQLSVVAENLVGVAVSWQCSAGFHYGNDGGILHEMAVATFIDFVGFRCVDNTADGIVIPAEGESGRWMTVRESVMADWTAMMRRWRCGAETGTMMGSGCRMSGSARPRAMIIVFIAAESNASLEWNGTAFARRWGCTEE